MITIPSKSMQAMTKLILCLGFLSSPHCGRQEDGVVVLERGEDGLAHEGVGDHAAREDDEHRGEPQRQRVLPGEGQPGCKI